MSGRRTQEQAPDREPTFEEFVAARKVIIYVRRAMAEARNGKGACAPARDPLALADSPIMAEIVMRSSHLCDPALFERSQLASAEGLYERSFYDVASAGE
jgi:hypothetical protein